MLPQPLKSIQRWHRAIAPHLSKADPHMPVAQIERGLCLLTLMAVSLPLCVARGLVEPDVLMYFWEAEPGQATGPYGKARSLLHGLNQQYHLGFPLESLPESLPMTREDWQGLRLHLGQFPFPIEWLGPVYEVLMANGAQSGRRRKIQGAYYTPPELVRSMVGQVLQPLPEQGMTVLDPACGGGAFLLAVYAHLLRRAKRVGWEERSHLLQHHIFGIDHDPLAVAVTRLSLLLKLREEGWARSLPTPDLRCTIYQGNSLVDLDGTPTTQQLGGQDWPTLLAPGMQKGGFDVVLGNPPYLDAEGMTRHQPELRKYCTDRYQSAKGNWDLFCVFIERALSFCREGGWHSFVVPNKLLSVPYGAAVRSLLAAENRLVQIRDYSRIPLFPAAVYPITYRVQRLPPEDATSICYEHMAGLERVEQQTWLPSREFQKGQQPWRIPTTHQRDRALARLQDISPLSQWATVTDAATVAEAYLIQPLLQEADPQQRGLPVANSGTLDRYRFLWGQKKLRYLGTTYQCPIIPARQLCRLPPQRLHQARQPKILVASMTRHLEAFLDETGGVLAGKSTTVILPHINPYWLLGLLNSQLIQVWFAHTFGGHRLQGGYLRVGPAQVRQIPIRLPVGEMGDRLTTLVQHRIALTRTTSPENSQEQRLDADIDTLVYQLYGLSPEDILAVMSG